MKMIVNSNSSDFDPTLQNCLFGAVKLTKIDKYKYSGYGIGFDSKGRFSHSNGLGRNAIIFGVDMSRNILSLGGDFIQGVDGTTIYAEKMYSINFSEVGAKFCLSLHYNGENSYLFVNGREMIKFKAKDSEIVEDPLCLRNISKYFSESNMKRTRLYGSFYYFSIDYNAIAVDILDFHSYLYKKYVI